MENIENSVREFAQELTLEVSKESFERGFNAAIEMMIILSNELPAHEGTIVRGTAQALREAATTPKQ